MRLAIAARAMCIGLLLGMLPSLSPAGHASGPPPRPIAPPPPPPALKAPENSKGTADVAPSDAAERHIKRTNCLKDARAKKIVGAQRNAYVKSCMAEDP